ncbi:hypothetical protein NLG97_g7743 [Lecanicillium saksenae]|uniref:Uncharacterized protein n=1 Tax=Lecanicillium saksenae TaxID=468837 RepID=A0ACC1QM32_9HYPO|nr:hypothetical protein NLG97_g7743 [Lecanicillium saksenae]
MIKNDAYQTIVQRGSFRDTSHPKRKKLQVASALLAAANTNGGGGVSEESTIEGHRRPQPAVTVAGLALEGTGLWHSGINAFVDHKNKYAIREIGPARSIQKAVLEARRGRTHPALEVRHPDDWTDEVEAAAHAAWRSDMAVWFLGRGVVKPYLKLFKICLQYGNCTPWDIVGVRSQLRFEPEGRASPYRVWSKPFCDALGPLVTHPVWATQFDGSVAADIVLIIQYAVILRTNDARQWRPSRWRKDAFIKAMSQYSSVTDGIR